MINYKINAEQLKQDIIDWSTPESLIQHFGLQSKQGRYKCPECEHFTLVKSNKRCNYGLLVCQNSTCEKIFDGLKLYALAHSLPLSGRGFYDTLVSACQHYGISFEEQSQAAQDERKAVAINRQNTRSNLTRAFILCHNYLMKEKPDHAIKYLRDRNIKQNAAREYKIGYMDDVLFARHSDLFRSVGIHPAYSHTNADGTTYVSKSWMNRLTLPILEPIKGEEVISATSRIISETQLREIGTAAAIAQIEDIKSAKYLNLSQKITGEAHKPMFGAFQAKKLFATTNKEMLVACEGILDVVTAHQNKLPAVSVMGAAPIEPHWEFFRATKNLCFCPDHDAAGIGKIPDIIADSLFHAGRVPNFLFFNKKAKDLDEFFGSGGKTSDLIKSQAHIYFMSLPCDNSLRNVFINAMANAIGKERTSIKYAAFFQMMTRMFFNMDSTFRAEMLEPVPKSLSVEALLRISELKEQQRTIQQEIDEIIIASKGMIDYFTP